VWERSSSARVRPAAPDETHYGTCIQRRIRNATGFSALAHARDYAIRETLIALELRGLVDARPGSGIYITEQTINDTGDDLRTVLQIDIPADSSGSRLEVLRSEQCR
jgi:hypothetical protein